MSEKPRNAGRSDGSYTCPSCGGEHSGIELGFDDDWRWDVDPITGEGYTDCAYCGAEIRVDQNNEPPPAAVRLNAIRKARETTKEPKQ